jgi:glycerol-3-phosphate O-acyltransferase/dihydroxyacetone phosphate acyltransferase
MTSSTTNNNNNKSQSQTSSSSSSTTTTTTATTSQRAPLFPLLRIFFQACCHIFYACIHASNIQRIPKTGTPTLIIFNHGNGLVDSGVLISTITHRTIRFCAKDTLWNVPFWGHLIRASGAIPVYRIREHGEKAQEYNEGMYRDAFTSLHVGNCLAIAPEGVSRFASNMAKPFKTGTARIALQAVEMMKDINPDYKVHVIPIGLTYTHREKFRSDVLVDVGEPIVVSTKDLPPNSVTSPEERSNAVRERARTLTEQMIKSLSNLTIDSPDFETTRLAMTATRLLTPMGTLLTLREHIAILREWVNILSTVSQNETKLRPLWDALKTYQDALDEKKIKDERVRRFQLTGKRPRVPIPLIIAYRCMVCVVLWLFALPGLLIWGPVWLMIKRREPQLLAKGKGWVDSVAEMKMLTSFIGCVVLSVLAGRKTPYVMILLWFTLRFYEEAMASSRSLYSHFKFLYLYPQTLNRLLVLRSVAVVLVDGISKDLFNPAALPVRGIESGHSTVFRPWFWEHWSIFGRKKKDWNEILRVHDFGTMDYFD